MVLDLMLEGMGKISWIKEIVESTWSVTKYIYNHTYVLTLVRQFIGNKELVHPAITHFATSFIALQSLHNSMLELQRMFLSDEWNACVYSTKVDGQAIVELVRHDHSFWMEVQELCGVSELLVKVLCLVDGEKPAMGYLYEDMDSPRKLFIGTMRTRGRWIH